MKTDRRSFIGCVAALAAGSKTAVRLTEPDRIQLTKTVHTAYGFKFPSGAVLERQKSGQYGLPGCRCGDNVISSLDRFAGKYIPVDT